MENQIYHFSSILFLVARKYIIYIIRICICISFGMRIDDKRNKLDGKWI